VEASARRDEIAALRAGRPLARDRVIELRSLGMHAIRFELVLRLLRAGFGVDTLSVYWERGHEFMTAPVPELRDRRLVLGRRRRVTGEFPDLWLLCYPEDAEIRLRVEQELDRMVALVRDRGGW
jgi:hypothetical protein